MANDVPKINYREPNFVQIKNDKAFEFTDQKAYENLGDAQMDYIVERMEKDYGLEKVEIPEEVEEGEAKCPIWMSPNLEDAEKLFLLIQGTGDV